MRKIYWIILILVALSLTTATAYAWTKPSDAKPTNCVVGDADATGTYRVYMIPSTSKSYNPDLPSCVGLNGKDGINGTNGVNGTNGINGVDGLPGKDGKNADNSKLLNKIAQLTARLNHQNARQNKLNKRIELCFDYTDSRFATIVPAREGGIAG